MAGTNVVDELEQDVIIVETTDLKNQEQQTERLKGKIHRVLTEINQRNQNIEQNLRGLRKQRNEQIVELRAEYDAALNKGDATGADKILAVIRKVHKDLVNVAKNAANLDSDLSDFNGREEELRLLTNKLCMLAGENFRLAKTLLDEASSLSGTMTYSLVKCLRELETTIVDTKKTAEEILSE